MSCSTHPVGCGRRARGIVWKYLNWKLLGITEREIQHTLVLLSSTAHALVLATDLWAGPRWGWRCSRCPWWGWRCRRGGDCWCPRGSPPGSGHPPAAARTARRENLARKYFHQHCKYFYNLLSIRYWPGMILPMVEPALLTLEMMTKPKPSFSSLDTVTS